MVLLETDRLFLRNVEQRDADVLFDYRNNDICAKYQRGQTKDFDGIVALIDRRKDDVISVDAPFMIAVALKSSNDMVGEIVVMPQDGAISLGYTFSYKYHRNGYAFESLSALIQVLHDRFPEWEFICFTEPENKASIALLLKLGYSDMGYSKKKASQVFGKWLKNTENFVL
jgi:RimJ/RimL family protein N-acetyltransferase